MNNSLRKAQAAYDNMSPPEDDGREEYIEAQASLLLEADDAELVKFDEFAEAAGEVIAEADIDAEVVQIILALRNNEFHLAQKLAQRFDEPLEQLAEKLLISSIDNHRR